MTGNVALYAVLVTAVSFLVNLWTARRGEARKVHRELLAPMLTELGDSLHSIVACSTVIAKRARLSQPLDKWKNQAAEAHKRVGALRRKTRYSLWGLAEGLRTLERVPSWIQHCGDRPEQTDDLLKQADRLRQALDNAIRNSYLRGRTPSRWERFLVDRHAEKLRQIWTRTAPSADSATGEDESNGEELLTEGPPDRSEDAEPRVAAPHRARE